MTNTTFEQSAALRQMIASAVSNGVYSPNGINSYLLQNGWKYKMPSRPTVEKLLAENKVSFVEGYWTKS